MRRVVCAAIRNGEHLICGARHMDSVMHGQLRDMNITHVRFGDWEQGFIDQRGEFMTREQAFDVAVLAGQLLPRGPKDYNGPKLFSEDLY